jgi:hypothetical protein
MKKLTALAATAALLLVPSLCFADETSDAEKCETQNGYCYSFLDDLLDAPGLDSTAPLLRVRPTGYRERLLRPRTQFVGELLKSVEKL